MCWLANWSAAPRAGLTDCTVPSIGYRKRESICSLASGLPAPRVEIAVSTFPSFGCVLRRSVRACANWPAGWQRRVRLFQIAPLHQPGLGIVLRRGVRFPFPSDFFPSDGVWGGSPMFTHCPWPCAQSTGEHLLTDRLTISAAYRTDKFRCHPNRV